MALSAKLFIAAMLVLGMFALVNAQQQQQQLQQRVPYVNEEPFNKWMHAGCSLVICWGILGCMWCVITLIHKYYGNKMF